MSVDNPLDNVVVPTTAQQIFTYLAGRVGEDVAQEVVIRYLSIKQPVRYPLRWAWRKAMWLKMDGGRAEARRRVREDASQEFASLPPDPLRVLVAKETLAGRRERLWKRYQEDYQVVQRLREIPP